MVKVDLITGFLGAGKTTFLKKYARYFLDKGQNIGILENDHGAVNIDMMLLQDLEGDNCELEMISGGCDYDCHYRRFKTKLIAMGMCGYDRVIIEPSGIFNVDEFFDILREEPLDRWYEIGSVITVVDYEALTPNYYLGKSNNLFKIQCASAGSIVISKLSDDKSATVYNDYSSDITEGISNLIKSCELKLTANDIIAKPFSQFDDSDFEKLSNAGYHPADAAFDFSEQDDTYDSVYIMESGLTVDDAVRSITVLFNDSESVNNTSISTFGKIVRIKGFIRENNQWFLVNCTSKSFDFSPIESGQEVLIVIGSKLNEDKIRKTLGIS